VHKYRWNWQLTHQERLHQCWKVCIDFRATCAPIQIPEGIFFREGLACFNKTMLNLYAASITTAWLHSRRVQGLDQICHQLETFGTSWNAESYKEEPELLSSKSLVSNHNETVFFPQRSISWSQFQCGYSLLLKEEGIHSGKHGPVPTFLRHVAAINCELWTPFRIEY